MLSFFPPTFITIVSVLWDFVSTWWWLFLPFLLYKPAVNMWKFTRQLKYDAEKMTPLILEAKVPASEIVRPFKAMESVWGGIWQIYDPPNKREEWLEGQFTGAITVEIVSYGGDIHIYLRFPKKDRRAVESAIYSQFPDAELTETEDYVTKVPPNIPNREWDMYGTDFRFSKPNVYPIRTFASFFEPTPESKEEQRIDPMGMLLEGLSQLREGEQIWLQIRAMPIANNDDETGIDYVGEAKEIVNKLAGRPGPAKPPSVVEDITSATHLLATGQERKEAAKPEGPVFDFPEMRLTPGEREVVQAIEQKVSKPMFLCTIRAVYLARKEVYFAPSKALLYNYFTQFATENTNAILPNKKTNTKVKTFKLWFLDARRVFVKKRHTLRKYKMRVPYWWPAGGGTILLNTEELASLFHFPGKTVAPGATIERVESKKGEAPPELPVEWQA